MKSIRCVDAFWLKMIMAVLMLLDHMYYFLPGQPYWFHEVSRLVAPVFTFLVAEGMVHTSNRERYIGRMFIVGGVMLAVQIGFQFIFGNAPNNSIMLALGVTASLIYCIDKVREKDGSALKWIALIVLLFISSIVVEGFLICPITGLVCYYLREKPLIMCAAYCASMAALLWILGMIRDTQALMLFAFVPFLLYNGKRGISNKFSKYFFYVFYPAHIWILFLVQRFFFAS